MQALDDGDPAALGRLYDRHAPLLLALGLRILGDRGRAEDVLHDVFLEAWHHAGDFNPARGTVRAWLATRMRSRALDRRTSVQRQLRLAEQATQQAAEAHGTGLAGSGAELGTDVAAALDSGRVQAQVSGMPPELAVVIELAYFEGLSSSEIAEHLKIPIGTVKSRTARALTMLRQTLSAAGGPR